MVVVDRRSTQLHASEAHFSPSPSTVAREAKRESAFFPRSADGQIGGLFPLRPPFWWWESGGAPDLCWRHVDSRVGFPTGAGKVEVVVSMWNKVAGAWASPRRCPLQRSRQATGGSCMWIVRSAGRWFFGLGHVGGGGDLAMEFLCPRFASVVVRLSPALL